MSGEIARCCSFVLMSKVTVADVAPASRLGPEVALPVGGAMRVDVAVRALVAAKAENSCTHECRRGPSVVTTYFAMATLAGAPRGGGRASLKTRCDLGVTDVIS
jgi:hypothetical protein